MSMHMSPICNEYAYKVLIWNKDVYKSPSKKSTYTMNMHESHMQWIFIPSTSYKTKKCTSPLWKWMCVQAPTCYEHVNKSLLLIQWTCIHFKSPCAYKSPYNMNAVQVPLYKEYAYKSPYPHLVLAFLFFLYIPSCLQKTFPCMVQHDMITRHTIMLMLCHLKKA